MDWQTLQRGYKQQMGAQLRLDGPMPGGKLRVGSVALVSHGMTVES